MSDEQTTPAPEGQVSEDNQSLLEVEKETPTDNQDVPHKEPDPNGIKAEDATEDDVEFVRPDFWPEQFWDDKEGPDIEKMLDAYNNLDKSYKELRTKMSQGKHKPPADGNYDVSMFTKVGVKEDDDLLQKYVGKAKELGVSQEAFEELASLYMEEMGQVLDNVKSNRDEEIKKLGPKATDILKANNVWLGKLSRSVLSEAETNAIVRASTNAAFISALNKIRQSSGEPDIPTDAVVVSEGAPSKDDLYAMVGDPRYGKDMTFTRNVEAMFQKAFGNQQYRP